MTGLHLFPDNVDLARAKLREGERLASEMDRLLDEVSLAVGVCPACRLEIRRGCRCPVEIRAVPPVLCFGEAA